LLGYYIQRRFKLPWIADFRDPWITGANLKPQGRFLLHWQSGWERKVIAHADIVIANAPRAAERLRQAFPPHQHKIQTILNGFDPENFDIVPGRHSTNGTLHILHTGEMYCGRDPKPFLDVMQDIHCNGNGDENSPPIRVHFLGRSEMGCHQFRTEIERRGLNHLIEISGQVPYNQATQAMTRSDILLLFDTPGRRAGVPAKLYEYIGVGRPVLALAERDSDVAWVLRESGTLHRMASPSDPLQIKQALAELIDEITANRLSPASEKQRLLFTRQAMAGRLAEIMNSAIHEKKQTSPQSAVSGSVS
jgi:glycosyltransferase involved in cell wall biosynthesis